MLILSRKPGEALVIDGNIEIRIVEVNGDKVKIGISAPKDVPVLRSELCQTVESNQEASNAVTPTALKQMLNTLKQEKGEA